jgi:creatinine amidohydrolase
VENRIALLRPAQIHAGLTARSVVYVPIGPLEWHGPHLPYGADALNAEATAAALADKTGGLVWPTQFWGTERERTPQGAANLGFARDAYIVGMDFPANSLASAYCPEEVFGLLVRELLTEVARVGARLAVISNGPGAVTQVATLERLAAEFNHAGRLRVHVRMAALRRMIEAASIAHAGAIETSLMLHLTESVDLSTLPSLPAKLRYADYAVVDGPGFDGRGPTDKTLDPAEDPRLHATAARGREIFVHTVEEIAAEVEKLLQNREGDLPAASASL